jgi:anti-sigma factor RsiW
MTITDEMLIAYLGGKLAEADRLKVEAAVASDPAVAERLRRHREVGAMIQDAISAGGRQAARRRGADHPAPVVSLADARKTRETPAPRHAPTPRRPLDPRWGVLVLGLLLGLAAGFFAPRPNTSLIDGDMTARGALAATLETRLAAEQKQKAPVRILATYRGPAGVWCRGFSTAKGLSGLACRSGDGWRVVMSELGATPPSAAQAAAVEALRLGPPVDTAAERAGRTAAWR